MKVVKLQWDNGMKIYSRPLDNVQAEETAFKGQKLYESDSYEILDYVEPGNGGCWFCYTESLDMLFDSEFDTFVHKDCLEAELKANPEHPEANLMAYLLQEDE